MKHRIVTLIIPALFIVASIAAPKQDMAQETERLELLNRIETLKTMYARFQEQYRETIENRWKQQQDHIRIKEEYKNSLEALRQRQEILYNEVSRAKEEALVDENAVQEQVDALKEKKELIDFLGKQVRDKISDAAKTAREGFPSGMEAREAQLNDIDARLARGENAAAGLKRLLLRRIEWLRESSTLCAERQTMVPGRRRPRGRGSRQVRRLPRLWRHARGRGVFIGPEREKPPIPLRMETNQGARDQGHACQEFSRLA